jgi:hypothetical protein
VRELTFFFSRDFENGRKEARGGREGGREGRGEEGDREARKRKKRGRKVKRVALFKITSKFFQKMRPSPNFGKILSCRFRRWNV